MTGAWTILLTAVVAVGLGTTTGLTWYVLSLARTGR